MKKQHIIALSVLIALFSSCFKDHSNYDYLPAEKITVTGIEATYSKITQVDSLVIIPKVSSTDTNAKFEYFWGMYETNVQGYAPKVDTISKAKDLRYFVTKPAKGWVLVFGAKNKNTGYTAISTASLSIITEFTRGWYVLKDDGSKTDIDLFLTPVSIVPGTKRENIFSQVNGKKLDGKAQNFCFETNYKSTVTGTLANTRAMLVTSEKDASIYDSNTLREIRDYKGCFYEAPVVKAPNAFQIGTAADYFINNGQLHSIYAMSANSGVFGVAQMKDDLNTPYRLSKFSIATFFNDPIFFDEISSSFVSAGGAGLVLNGVRDATGTHMPAINNNKTLLYMGAKTFSQFSGVAIFKDKTNPALQILSQISASSVSAFKMVNDTIAPTKKLYNASMYSVNYIDEGLLYFVVGNQVWSYNLTNKFEQLQFTAPAGETITYLRHRKYSVTADIAFAYNFVMIGTKSGSNYTVRMFNKTAGILASTPAVTLTGTGSVGDVFYLSPNINYTTYPVSY